MPGTNEYMLFEDGGFGSANNPTEEGTRELEDLYGNNSIGIVVSVGTARKDEGNQKRAFWKTIPRVTKQLAAMATNPEGVHRNMERRVKRATGSDFSYHRLNDPGRLGVKLDDWEPKKTMFKKVSGSTTLGIIEMAFDKWASQIDVQDQLRQCAATLVKCRRARIRDEDKWERFATGARFTCQARNCDHPDFLERTRFREHLRERHPDRPNSQGQEEKTCMRTWRYKPAPKSPE